MQLTGQDIRTLRQRLGWSLAEMARQMGCTTELVARWESGSSLPEPETMNRIQYLQGHVDSNSARMMEDPVCEIRIESERLSQLTHRDLLKDS